MTWRITPSCAKGRGVCCLRSFDRVPRGCEVLFPMKVSLAVKHEQDTQHTKMNKTQEGS